MGDQNMASQQNQVSIIKVMNSFNFDEGTIERTITFDSSSDTENEETELKSEPLSPETAEETLNKAELITTNSFCNDSDAKIIVNKELRIENIPINDTRQIDTQQANQLNNESGANTNLVQSFNSVHCSLPCINETLEHTEINNEDPDLQDSKPKKQKTNFPRTKFTSRRQVKKFPGKMDSMKNMHSEQISQEPIGQSLSNSDDIIQLSIDNGRRTPESEQRIMAALKIVAQNLINISPYLNRYMKTNHRLNATDYKIASEAFKNAKFHYFALSYSTVASTIMPYAKDPKFMEHFYDLTFQLAEQKGIPNTFSEKSLQILCSEMIAWTQMKILQHKNDEMSLTSVMNRTPSTNSTQSNALEKSTRILCPSNTAEKKNLHKSSRTLNTSHHNEATNNIRDITLVFPAEHLNSAIKISYNPALTSQLSIPSQSCTNVNSNITVHNNINTNNYPGQPHTQSQRYPQCIQKQQQSPNLYNLLQEDVNRNSQKEVQQCLQPLAIVPNLIRQNPLSSIKIKNCYQLPASPETIMCSGSNIPHMLESYHSSPGNYQQTDIPPQKAWSFGQQQVNQMDQSKTNQRNFIRLNNYPQERSSSRDSGFFSPVQDNQQDCLMSPRELTTSPSGLPSPPPYSCNTYQQPPIGSPATMKTPPSSTLRNCIVCKKPTNLTCLGCSNTYYCGNTCQNMDWMYHSKYCRNM